MASKTKNTRNQSKSLKSSTIWQLGCEVTEFIALRLVYPLWRNTFHQYAFALQADPGGVINEHVNFKDEFSELNSKLQLLVLTQYHILDLSIQIPIITRNLKCLE